MIRACMLALALLFAAGTVHSQSPEGRLKKIAATKLVTIAYRADAAPFSFTDDKQQVVGFSIDLCKRVVNSIERQLNMQGLQIKWHPVTTQTRFDVVARGQADLECGSSTITLARLKLVDFSSTIFVESTGLLTRAESGLRSLSDMSGRSIAVVGGTTNERAVEEQLKRRQVAATVVSFKARDEAFAALMDGKVDALASDKLLLLGAARNVKDRKLLLLPDQLSFEPYGIVLPRGDSDLRLAVNAGLAQLYRTGEIMEIFGRWFGGLGDPGPVVRAVYLLGAIPE